MERTWSADSAVESALLDKPTYLATFDASKPRPHRRRSSLPVGSSTASNQPGTEIRERRKFRENTRLASVNEASQSKSKSGRSPNWATTFSRKSDLNALRTRPRIPHNASIDTTYSSTYAAGPSGSDGREGDSADSETENSTSDDALAFQWDVKGRSSSMVLPRTLRSYLSPPTDSQPSTSTNNTRSPSPWLVRSTTPEGRKTARPAEEQPISPSKRATNSSSAQHRSARSAHAGNPVSEAANTAAASRAANDSTSSQKPNRQPLRRHRRSFNSIVETTLLLGTGVWACWKLGSRPEAQAQQKAGELALVIVSTFLYFIFTRSPGLIWSTDARSFRPCDDDGSVSALLMGPLLATTMLLSSLEASASTPLRSRSPNQEPLPRPPWLVESPVAILGERNRKAFLQATGLSALSLSQSTLLSLQTVISLIFLIHLIATRISRTLQTTPSRGNWRRFSSYVVFSSGVTFTLFIMREAFEALGLPIWTGLARWEMITASISFQTNMYSISRLGRGSFTLGELGIVAALGVTLMIETINLTLARLFPNSTLFLKTFRTATPLLIFQLALIVGTFFIGFLLSPLLYLSRHLAQKPVHRLRWPHKRDLHRRLLAGFFYLFAAAYIVGALGLWVRWMLDGRDPWIWTAFFVVDGQRWWTRPAIITHWILWISASIAGWQTVVVRAKRLRPRNPVAAQKAANTKLMGNSHSHTHETSAAAHAQSPSSWNIVPGRSSETLQTKVKKSTHLSLNARRKFFHALAVILYTPAIALDPALAHLAFSLAFSVFTFAEYVRYYALYPFGATLHIFLSEFTDHKDSGPVILSHFYLLTGCGGGLWLEGHKQISHHTGVLILGIGDALASVIGRKYGRVHWPRSSKTIEGSIAFLVSVIAAAWLLRAIGWCEHFSLLRYSGAVAALCLMEGVSEQNDNLILPIFGFICLGIFDV